MQFSGCEGNLSQVVEFPLLWTMLQGTTNLPTVQNLQCSWRKDQVQTRLREHNIDFNIELKKSELLQLAFVNLPQKEYKVDLKAKTFDVEISRLAIKHCSLNPIELVW